MVQVYNLSNWHWVLRLLLIAPTREYLCLNFDPVCDRPHIVGANQEELVVVDLIVFEILPGEDGGMHGISGLPPGRSARLCARVNPSSVVG